MEYRICKKCKENKPLKSFYHYGDRGLRRKSCDSCCIKQAMERRYSTEENKTKLKNSNRAWTLKRHRISQEDFNTLFKEQEGKCKICGILPKRTLNIDHCHISGKIRGLLCWNCNMALGYFKDSISNLEKAIKYLKFTKSNNSC